MFRARVVVTGLACLFHVELIKPAASFLTTTPFRGVQPTTSNFASSAQRPPCPTMSLEPIKVTNNPSEDEINALGARSWPTWGCGVSKFPWLYEGTETCFILEGEFTVTPDDDRESVTVGPGDLCVFPNGMKCTWDVRAPVKKHYKFE